MKRTTLVLTLTLLLFAPPVTVSAADGSDTSPSNKVLGQSARSATQAGGANLGGGAVQWTGGDLNITNQSLIASDPIGGSQPHTDVSTILGLSFILSLLTKWY